jgi:hypothetical protein
VITLAVDDVDNYKGPLTNGQSTNDTLPQLNGTSEPNAIVPRTISCKRAILRRYARFCLMRICQM